MPIQPSLEIRVPKNDVSQAIIIDFSSCFPAEEITVIGYLDKAYGLHDWY